MVEKATAEKDGCRLIETGMERRGIYPALVYLAFSL
jgi:hypothetical protein